MKVAVIGTGIAGNYAAYQLSKQHDIAVFEANDYIGGHTHTHDINHDGIDYAIDSGFIVFNELTYPHFISLLSELGVPYEKTQMSFGVKNSKNGLEYSGRSLNSLFAQRSNLFKQSFFRMLNDILRFNRTALASLENHDDDITLGDFLAKGRFTRDFIDNYIVPMGAAIWSTDPKTMQDFPAKFFIRFFANHGLLTATNQPQWHVIKGGSHNYVAPLVAGFKDRIQLNSPVISVRRLKNKVELNIKGKRTEQYDAVFIACHSDQALSMLSDASKQEQAVLGAIKYQSNEAVIHTDETVLPKQRLAWAAWNYHVMPIQGSPVALTYNMNILQNLSAKSTFCVTLNSSEAIDTRKVIKKVNYSHPIYTPESIQAQQRHAELNSDRTYFCGAYWRNGFHEDGIMSAMDAVAHFEAKLGKQANA